MSDVSLTPRELDVISVLWQRGSGTVAEVKEGLEKQAGYTTVLKILQILQEKGYVRFEPEGRAYRYFPVLEPAAAGDSALTRVLGKIFGGSADMLLAELINDRKIPPEQLKRMRKLLREYESEE